MTRLPRVNGREVIAALKRGGFRVIRVKGSHHFLRSAEGRCTVVPIHGGEVLVPGLTAKSLRDCQLTSDDLIDLLRNHLNKGLFLRDGEGERDTMELVQRCLKIDKPSAAAMITGFRKSGEVVRQSIWCAVADRPFPALITFNRTPSRFDLSTVGCGLDADHQVFPLSYAAVLDSQYFIRNDRTLWQVLCSNGLFDIWNPAAAFCRFEESGSDPARYRIQLLRVYALDRQFRPDEVRAASSRVDHLVATTRTAKPVRPVIAEPEFVRLKSLLKDSVSRFLTRAGQVEIG
jgi:predicted RNA binding protein YcfA (HicA-like mRNA interferase family)